MCVKLQINKAQFVSLNLSGEGLLGYFPKLWKREMREKIGWHIHQSTSVQL